VAYFICSTSQFNQGCFWLSELSLCDCTDAYLALLPCTVSTVDYKLCMFLIHELRNIYTCIVNQQMYTNEM
jgi:hypothetical protein